MVPGEAQQALRRRPPPSHNPIPQARCTYIVGRAEAGEFGLAIAYSSVLIAEAHLNVTLGVPRMV